MSSIVNSEHIKLAERVRNLLSTYLNSEDLINIGAYKRGASPQIDEAIYYYPKIIEFFKQAVHENFTTEETVQLLSTIVIEGE
jgi:flagellum-specific ATP synthase